jgi:hypothetical protein
MVHFETHYKTFKKIKKKCFKCRAALNLYVTLTCPRLQQGCRKNLSASNSAHLQHETNI